MRRHNLTSWKSTHHFSIVMCTRTYCLWYLSTASLLLRCRTLVNIIMQNKESDNIDKNTVSSIRSWKMLISILCRIKCLRVWSKTVLHHCIFHDPFILFVMKPIKLIKVLFKGQGFQRFHYYCSASVCNLTTRVSHRCNSQMIIKTQTMSLLSFVCYVCETPWWQ